MNCNSFRYIVFASIFIFGISGFLVVPVEAQNVVIDSVETSPQTMTNDGFSLRVAGKGDLNVAGDAVTITDASGNIQVEKGGKITGTGAIDAALTSAKRVTVSNYGTITGGINNSGSTSGTFTLNNYAGGEFSGDYTGGSGADNLSFYEGSKTITGDIALGAGSNSILLGKDVVLNGNLTSGSIYPEGTTFVLYGTSDGRSQIIGSFESGSSLNNLLRLSPGDAKGVVDVGGGTLLFSGKLETTILKEAGTNQVFNSKIISTTAGTLMLNELRLNPQEGTGTWKAGDGFKVNGGSVGLNGIPKTIIAPGEMLTFDMNHASRVISVTSRENFADYASGNITRQLAQNVDLMIDAGTMPEQLDRVFGELQFGTKANVTEFFRENDPSANLAFAGAGFRTTQFITQGLTDRMELLRKRRTYGQGAANTVFRGQDECPIGTGCNHRDRDLFVRGFGAYHKEDAASGLLGYDATSSGLQVGYDWRVTNRSYFGLSAAFANIDIDIDDTNNSGKDFMLRFGGYYTKALSGGAFFDAEISYGNHDNQYDRHYNSGLGWRDVHSRFRSQDLSVYLGLGKKITCDSGFYYKPFAAVQYIYYHQPGYEEQGNYGVYQFASKDMSSFLTRFALKFGREQFRRNRYLGYELEAGYNLELADNARITGGWIGGQNDLFTLSRSDGFENGFYGSAKLHVRPAEHVELFTRYLAEGSKGGFLHGLEFGGQWRY